LDLLTPYKNKNVHSGIGLGSFWSWKDGPLVFDDMSMGLNIQFKNDPYFSENLTDFVLRSMGDAHFIMGKAIPFFNDESLRIGASGRIGYRVNTESNYNLIDIFANHVNPPLFTAESTRERVYVDVDAGVQWDLPFYQRYRPRIGISALNLLNQKQILNPHLLYATSGDNVEEFQRRLNVGLSTRLPAFYIFEPTIAFDVKDIGIYTASIWNRLHLGVDIKFLLYEWWEGSIRLGIDQGYFTAGGYGLIGVGFKGTLDIVYYGREVGWVAGQNGDQRLLVQIGFKI
jgi:hypothetical protein